MSDKELYLLISGILQKSAGLILIIASVVSMDVAFMAFAIPVGLGMVATRKKLF